jgi:hypothetical protein
MPNSNTFSIPPIREFVSRYVQPGVISADPFARGAGIATFTNDLNPATKADYHFDAEEFCKQLAT